MSDDYKFKSLKEKIEDLKKEIPNIDIPTMGIIEEEQDLKIDSKDYMNNETKEED